MIAGYRHLCLKIIIFILFILKIKSISVDEIDFNKLSESQKYEIKPAMYPQDEDFYTTFDVPRRGEFSPTRKKRKVTLAYPGFPVPTLLVTDFYINIPLLAPAHVFLPMTLQARSYMLFPNNTIFDFWSYARSLNERVNVFQWAEQVFQGFGLDGKICVLRAVCEKSEFHIIVDGFVNEAVSLLLEFSSPGGDITFRDYEVARERGRTKGSCGQRYSGCPISVFNILNDPFL